MKNRTAFTNERNLFLPALAGFFVAGIWLATRVMPGLWPLWLLPGIALLLPVLRLLRLPYRLALLPLALLLAMLWTLQWLYPAMPPAGKYETITATVYGDSKLSSTGNVSVRLMDIALDGAAQPGMAYGTVYVDAGDIPVQLYDGQTIRFSGKVYAPYPKDNRFDFDFRMWMLTNGLHYGISGIEDIQILAVPNRWADYAGRIADACYAKLANVAGERADLAVAMLLGERSALAEEDYAAFQQAGVAHVMAVSGLHVGILSAALLWLLRRFRLRKFQQIPVLAAFLLLYCGVTGFAVSSLRAAVMILLWVIGGAFGRKPNPVTVISTAMLIVLIINPLQLFSAGFVLSFSAIGGIALLYPRFIQGLDRVWKPVKVKRERSLRRFAQRMLRRFKQLLAVSLAAQLGVMLPIAAYYHALYPYSLSFNLFIVPLVGVLVPLYAVTAMIVWIPWLGGWLGPILGELTRIGGEALLWIVRTPQNMPFSSIRVAVPNVWVCVAALSVAVLGSHFIRASARKRLLAAVTVIVIAATGSVITAPPPVRYHQLSVGWADAALLIDGNKTIGIDTGKTGSEMVSRLLAEGRDLDALILTHLHADHAGGVTALLESGIAIGHVYIPVDYSLHGYSSDTMAILQTLAEQGIPVTEFGAGDTLRFHETSIDILWPEPGYTRMGVEPNDRSIAMLITLDGVRMLGMGDNGFLYERYAAVQADILKVGHHGSKSGTGEAFLEIVAPTLAIVSERTDALPAAATLERLTAGNVTVLSTDEAGEITIVPIPGGYRAYRYIPEGTQ